MTQAFSLKSAKTIFFAVAASAGLAFAAPAMAGDFTNISINGLDFDDEDFLQQLIDMDADDIADLRSEMADARAEIRDAISEIEDARAEVEDNPEAKPMFIAAMEVASSTVTSTTKSVFDKVRAGLDQAETDLNSGSVEVSDEELTETRQAIAALREELSGIEAAVGELVAAMKA